MEMKSKLERFYDITTGILALFAVSLAIIDMDRGLNEWQRIADNIVLAVFVVDYVVRLCIAKNKKIFFKENIFDLVAIFPFSSFFRAFAVFKFISFSISPRQPTAPGSFPPCPASITILICFRMFCCTPILKIPSFIFAL